jgi:large subunit ribosomal protein L15
MQTHKRKKSTRMHGRKMGTHGGGARKKRKGHGHRGGRGMSGTGKRSGQKITLVAKLPKGKYFGKKGVTSLGTKRDKLLKINLRDISAKYKPGEIELSKHKILGAGEIKGKFVIKALSASKSAIEKVKAAGGEIILPKVKEKKVVKKPEEVKEKVVDKKSEKKEAKSEK